MQSKTTILKSFFTFILVLVLFGTIHAEKTYEGKVIALVKSKLKSGTDFGYWGMLNNTARMGEIIKPQITSKNGDVVHKGTVVIQLETKYWKARVESDKATLNAAQQNLLTAEENYKRYKKLSPTGATSTQIYQIMRAAYYTALGDYKEAQADLIETQQVLDACTHVAPFEGIVDKVYFSRGHVTDNPPSVQVSQLNPIGVKILMSRKEANAITANTPVSIYYDSDKTIGVYNGFSMLADDGIILITDNFPKITGKTDSIKVRNCTTALNFDIANSSDDYLGVSIDTLKKDKDGFFVWKAKDRKKMQPGKGMNPTFQVEKVYVIPGNLKRLYFGVWFIRNLIDPGSLKINDLLLTNAPDNLKTDDWVTLLPERYVLMPGDSVKVLVGN